MDSVFKWILFYTLLLLTHTATAWTIGSKGRVVGPAIHMTYFLTPNNAPTPVQAYAYLGIFINGTCAYHTVYNLGQETLKTGDQIYIDGFQLKSAVGMNYNCAMITYTAKRMAAESFILESDGFSYFDTFPNSVGIMISMVEEIAVDPPLLRPLNDKKIISVIQRT